MKKFVGFYYRCSFKVCLCAFLSLIGSYGSVVICICPTNMGILIIRFQRHGNNHRNKLGAGGEK